MPKGKKISPTTINSEKLIFFFGGGIAKLICMSKVRIFSEIAPNTAFSEFIFYELYYKLCEKTSTCMLHSTASTLQTWCGWRTG